MYDFWFDNLKDIYQQAKENHYIEGVINDNQTINSLKLDSMSQFKNQMKLIQM